ncbi:hypothetical protein B566_EDAN017991 [Ephemera danica]|nr:hypothetical protein B566_EDAN017991 [Ephemera danica]
MLFDYFYIFQSIDEQLFNQKNLLFAVKKVPHLNVDSTLNHLHDYPFLYDFFLSLNKNLKETITSNEVTFNAMYENTVNTNKGFISHSRVLGAVAACEHSPIGHPPLLWLHPEVTGTQLKLHLLP